MSAAMLHESIWFDWPKYERAESHYQRSLVEGLSQSHPHGSKASSFSPVQEIAKARKKIQETLSTAASSSVVPAGDDKRIAQLEEENRHLKEDPILLLQSINQDFLLLYMWEPPSSKQSKDDDDDNFDLFGSDEEEEDEEETEERKARLAAYKAKKSKKPVVVAKSNIILDIKPVSKAAKFLPVAYGIQKIQISCVVEDDKIGTDFLEEKITEFEDYVQSVDVVAFNKV
ncbi:Elongation factor 1-delta [Acropora cervicornis]|uniref:Elongation factor 1-delta n=1 Tax=Acropora cervicornis TaxID=6130 RepID=A0AAD9V0V5_ACRCE|nr:Elongation factor 1-delta [Acropora cervicornis]